MPGISAMFDDPLSSRRRQIFDVQMKWNDQNPFIVIDKFPNRLSKNVNILNCFSKCSELKSTIKASCCYKSTFPEDYASYSTPEKSESLFWSSSSPPPPSPTTVLTMSPVSAGWTAYLDSYCDPRQGHMVETASQILRRGSTATFALSSHKTCKQTVQASWVPPGSEGWTTW